MPARKPVSKHTTGIRSPVLVVKIEPQALYRVGFLQYQALTAHLQFAAQGQKVRFMLLSQTPRTEQELIAQSLQNLQLQTQAFIEGTGKQLA